MTRCLTSLVIREVQIKATRHYHYISTRMTEMKKRLSSIGEILCWQECKVVNCLALATKANMCIPDGPAILLLGICTYQKCVHMLTKRHVLESS